MMAEYIEREAVSAEFECLSVFVNGELYVRLLDVGEHFKRIPAADVVEVVHGRWEPRMQDDGYGEYLLYFCSECGAVSPNSTRNYCQNCGADMRVGEEEKLERHSKEDGE